MDPKTCHLVGDYSIVPDEPLEWVQRDGIIRSPSDRWGLVLNLKAKKWYFYKLNNYN